MRSAGRPREQLPHGEGGAARSRDAGNGLPHPGRARPERGRGRIRRGGRERGALGSCAPGRRRGRARRIPVAGACGPAGRRADRRRPRLAETAAREGDPYPGGVSRRGSGVDPGHGKGQGGRRGAGKAWRIPIRDDCWRTMADRPGRRGSVKIDIVPSILSADVGRLTEQVKEAEAAGADRIQVDVMDGHFVPNLTFGPQVVEAVRRATKLPIEAHLMVERPEVFLEAFAKAGATLIAVRVEASSSVYRSVKAIGEV